MFGLETRFVIRKDLGEFARPEKKREWELLFWKLQDIDFETQLSVRDLQPLRGTTVLRERGESRQVEQ